ncbi:AcrR Transcriptional regulator [Candidatus Nanopelagicaceae bacterium]
MPKIETHTLAEHRDWRRNQLIEAAAAIALESGGEAITVAAVAARAGLSRTSVYEYFASSADLAADLIIEELKSFGDELATISARGDGAIDAIDLWIQGSLQYIADGRHLLAKALNAIDLPRNRSAAIGAAHGALLAPLKSKLAEMGVKDISFALTLIQSITDGASRRIESGDDAELVIKTTREFCIAGLTALVR